MSSPDRRRYTSPGQAAARFVAQQGLLRPYLRTIIDLHVHGKEYARSLPETFIAVANHSSHLDAAIIMTALPLRCSHYLATGAAADYFFDAWYKAAPTTLFFNAFPIERKGTRTRRSLAGTLVSDGVPLLLFPEGTRSRTGAMAPFKPGAAALCISRDVPALPIALVGAFAAWPTTQNHPPQGRPPVHCVFGRPMYPAPGEIAHQFAARMYRQVHELHDTTARAYNLPTLDDYARAVAVREASIRAPLALGDTVTPRESAAGQPSPQPGDVSQSSTTHNTSSEHKEQQ